MPSYSEVINIFKQNISSQIDTWGVFEMSMADYAKALNSESELLECGRDFRLTQMIIWLEKNELSENI